MDGYTDYTVVRKRTRISEFMSQREFVAYKRTKGVSEVEAHADWTSLSRSARGGPEGGLLCKKGRGTPAHLKTGVHCGPT